MISNVAALRQTDAQTIDILGSSMTWDRSTTHPKFDPTGVRTHDPFERKRERVEGGRERQLVSCMTILFYFAYKSPEQTSSHD